MENNSLELISGAVTMCHTLTCGNERSVDLRGLPDSLRLIPNKVRRPGLSARVPIVT